MILSVKERLILLSTLPAQGDITALKIIRKLQEDLSFSEEEHKELKFVQESEGVRWDDKKEIPKDVQIGEKAMDIIVDSLKKLNAQKKLSMDQLGIYERFVEKKEDV